MRTRRDPDVSARSCQVDQHGAADSADDGCDSDGVETVLLTLDTDVIAGFVEWLGCRAIDHRASEVLRLEHVTELLDTPVRDEELQACLRPQSPIPVVTEEGDDADPHVGHVVEWYPRAQSFADARIGRETAADPDVESRTVFRVFDTDEGHIVDFVNDVLKAGDGGLELARQVGVFGVRDQSAGDLVQGGRGVEDLVDGDAGHRRAEDHPRGVTCGFGGREAHIFEPPPDFG